MGRLSANANPLASPLTSPKRLEAKPDIHHVVLGDILFETWFPSFYPEELVGKDLERLYVCQWCFKYTAHVEQHLTHQLHCEIKTDGLPGEVIYQQENHGIIEVDGEQEQLFAQNLSLFAKLFLDNKSVFFDVASFNYYLLTHQPSDHGKSTTPQAVGFFSKEKMSWDNNNLACILVFPPWQRKGLGKILMGVSYELSEREGRYGGPEKPLSALGKRGYMQFWEARLARTVLDMKGRKAISVTDLAKESWVLTEDVIASLKRMGVLGAKRKDGSVAITKKAVREWIATTGVDITHAVSTDAFIDLCSSDEG